jgi:hypothetical protein
VQVCRGSACLARDRTKRRSGATCESVAFEKVKSTTRKAIWLGGIVGKADDRMQADDRIQNGRKCEAGDGMTSMQAGRMMSESRTLFTDS